MPSNFSGLSKNVVKLYCSCCSNTRVVTTVASGFDDSGATTSLKEVTDVATAAIAKNVLEAVAAKEATMKKTIDVAAMKKAAEVTTAQKVVEEVEGTVMEKAAKGSVGSGSSHAPAVGTKRAMMPSSSTPPPKRFHCTWNSKYVE
jgi:hypothetical protein